MDPNPEHVGLEEVEKLTSDDSCSKPDGGGLHKEHKSNDTNINGQSSATSNGLEKREDVEIVDWDGPNDPENPYARNTSARSRTNNRD